ncbi:MAG TPA: lamin tail domain-containing protein [Candidatus Methylacidiphilales bacterium]
MKNLHKLIYIVAGTLSLAAFSSAKAQIIITEVDASGSSTSTYAADWFELTNYGSSAVNISGWEMDDSSDSLSDAVPLSLAGNTIAAGQSVVFIETSGTTLAALTPKFESAWFGTNVPAGFTIGGYSGSGVSLSQTNDAVNIFNASGTQVTGVDFNASTNHVSFDNSVARVGNDGVISTLSVAGVNGAFVSPTGETGSPGVVPEPSTYALLIGGMLALAFIQIRRRTASKI